MGFLKVLLEGKRISGCSSRGSVCFDIEIDYTRLSCCEVIAVIQTVYYHPTIFPTRTNVTSASSPRGAQSDTPRKSLTMRPLTLLSR